MFCNYKLKMRKMRLKELFYRVNLHDNLELSELHHFGRLYNWNNECAHPTLQRIDRASALVDWLGAFLRVMNANVHACHTLDFKLRNMAKASKSWSIRCVQSIRVQLAMARELIVN